MQFYMLPLHSATFPATAAELKALLNRSVQELFEGAPDAVAVEDLAYPELRALTLTLDGASLRPNPPRPPALAGATSPALTAESLQLAAAPLRLGPVGLQVRLAAEDVALHQGRDAAGEIMLVLQSAKNGTVEISAPATEVEQAIAALAKAEAGKHGVTIEEVKLHARSRDERSVDAEVQVLARKLFFRTTVRIRARLELDDDLNARLSEVSCEGEGAIGSVACGVLEPHVRKLDGRVFPLMALPLGEIKLREVRLAAGDQLRVSAEFGA